jgi:hypothetical protein
MWGRSYYRPQQQTTGWDALAQIVGAISQRNQENAQADALTNMNFDAPTDTRLNTAGIGQGLLTAGQQFNSAPQQFGIDQTGLLSSKQPAQTMPFQPSLLTQEPAQTMPMQTNQQSAVTPFQKALNGSQPQPATVSPTVQQPREYRTTQEAMRDFQPQMRTAVMNLVKAGYSAKDAFQIASQKANELAGIRVKETQDKYASQADDELLQAFGSSDPRTILKAAAKHKSLANRYGFQGADMQLVAQAIKMGAKEFITQQENGENVTYARTPDGQMTEVHRSNPGITDAQKRQYELTERGQNITMRGQDLSHSASMASSSNTGSRYINTPLGAMTTDQLIDNYTKAKGGRIKTTDAYGQESYREVPPNHEVLRILGPLIQQAGGGQAQQTDPRLAAAKAAGYSDAEIAAFVNGAPVVSQEQSAQQPAPVTANFMGETVQNAVPGYQIQLPQQIVPAEENAQRDAWLRTLGR